jgi:hypothetical protein
MNIDLTKFRTHWFEDKDGNFIEPCTNESEEKKKTEDVLYYHHGFPCQYIQTIDEYCWHPTNPIIKWLCRNEKIYKLLSKGKDKTFKSIMTINTTYNSGSDCIVAMVNSGDYTLEEAIWIYANSCERCMNVLCHKYLDGKDGYEEHSEEWKRAGTVCIFCSDEMKGE